MVVAQMRLQLLSTQTSILILTATLSKKPWIGRKMFYQLVGWFLFNNYFLLWFWIPNFDVICHSDLRNSLSNHWCLLMLPWGKLKLLILVICYMENMFFIKFPLGLAMVEHLFWAISFLVQRIKRICCLTIGEWIRYRSFYYLIDCKPLKNIAT